MPLPPVTTKNTPLSALNAIMPLLVIKYKAKYGLKAFKIIGSQIIL